MPVGRRQGQRCTPDAPTIGGTLDELHSRVSVVNSHNAVSEGCLLVSPSDEFH